MTLSFVYTVASLVGLQWTVAQGVGAVIWPAAGVALAGLLIGGVRLWPAIFLGRMVAAAIVQSVQPWWGDALIALGAAIPALVIVSRPRFNPMLASLSDLFLFAAVGAALGGAISALAGVGALAMANPSAQNLGLVFTNWILGFAGGVLTFGPLLLSWSPAAAWREPPRSWLHFSLFVVTIVLVIGWIFSRPQGFVQGWHLYPLLIWAALAFNTRGSSVFLVLLAAGAVAGARLGLGPIALGDQAQRLLQCQQYVLVASVCTLVLAAVADERRGTLKLQDAARVNAREIAQRCLVEEQLRLVINELNHRVKNSLATVQSLASQTLRAATTPQEAREKLVARIVALASAHDVLTRQKWRSADLADLVRAALLPFARESSLHLSGPNVHLEPTIALAMAMALHELATNAIKYGALGAAEGRVTVTWRRSSRNDEPGLIVDWRESGGPLVLPPNGRGFGSRLLLDALPRQLHGTVLLSFDPEGLRCQILASLATHPAK